MDRIKDSTAVILCGGKSSRMGFDKSLLRMEDDYLLKVTADTLGQIFEEVVLITNSKEKFIPIKGISLYPMIEDHYPGMGPVGAICTAFESISTPYLFVMACDMPEVNTSVIYDMYQQIHDHQILLFEEHGKQEPLFSFYHRSCFPVLKKQLEEGFLKLRGRFSQLDVKTYTRRGTVEQSMGVNLNTVEDIELWKNQKLIEIPNMLMIGSAGRNSGKTTLATALIKQWTQIPVVGVKVVTIQKRDGQCPRGGKGCGTCTNIEGDYVLTQENPPYNSKDTSKMLEAGAKKVFFLRVMKTHMKEGIQEFLKQVPKGCIIICESNTLRKHVKPGVFVFLNNTKGAIKPTAREVMEMADITVQGEALDVIEQLEVQKLGEELTISLRGNDNR